MALAYTCPKVNSPVVDTKTGMPTRAWYQYYINLFDTVNVADPVSKLAVSNLTVSSLIVTNPVASLNVSNLTVSNLSILSTLTFANPITNSLTGDVALNNTGLYFDGPSVTQGTVGTWFISGIVTVKAATTGDFFFKLWDGTTIIASAAFEVAFANHPFAVSLSGVLTSPTGNIRISVRDTAGTDGSIVFNDSGNSKDSTITAYRIA